MHRFEHLCRMSSVLHLIFQTECMRGRGWGSQEEPEVHNKLENVVSSKKRLFRV